MLLARRALVGGPRVCAAVLRSAGRPVSVWRDMPAGGLAQRRMSGWVASTTDNLRVYTRGEVARHDTDEDLWVIVDGRVYDLTEWANFHPGSRDVLVMHAGRDATEYFNEVGHSEYARNKMKQFCIGRVDTPPRYTGSEYFDRPGEV